MGVTDKLNATFGLYRRHFTTMITVVAVVVVPIQLVSALLAAWLIRDIEIDPEAGTIDFPEPVWGLVLGIVAVWLLSFLTGLLATAGVTKVAADDYRGLSADWREAVRFGFSKLGTLVAGTILFSLAIAGTLLGGILAAIALGAALDELGAIVAVVVILATLVVVPVLLVSWSLWVPAAVTEDLGAVEALGRSNELVGGRRWQVFGFLALVFVLVAVAQGIVGNITSIAGLTESGDTIAVVLWLVVSVAASLLITPAVAAAFVVLYYDQRVRKEPLSFDDPS